MAEERPLYKLPDEKTLATVGDTQILAADGSTLPFKSFYTGDNASTRQLIIFIRHFFCGSCEQYVRTLTHHFPPSTLSTQQPPVRLTLIGCGAPRAIPSYKTRTACPYEIYCDPERKLYRALGMIASLKPGEKKPEYITKGTLANTLGSVWNILSSPVEARVGGDYAQNGGEWVFEDGVLKWGHRMGDTMGHAEVGELKEVLGLKE